MDQSAKESGGPGSSAGGGGEEVESPTMKRWLALLILSSLSSPLWGQEGFRTETVADRPFTFSRTYFLDILTFQHPEEWQAEWDATRNGFRMTVGSVRTNEFYIDQEARYGLDFGKWFHGRLQIFQREDFDSRYLRILSGGDVDLTDRVTLGAFTTLLPNKEQIDVGFSTAYLVDRTNYLSLSFLMVDTLFNKKSEGNERLAGDPSTLKLQGSLRPVDDWTLTFRLGRDFPLRFEFRDDGFDFLHRKVFYSTRLSGSLFDRWSVILRLQGENGERERDYDAPDPDGMEQVRDHFRFRLEVIRRLLGRFKVRGGFDFFYLFEATRFPDAPAESERILLREATLYGGVSLPVPFTERFSFRPALYLSRFDDENLFPGDPGRTREVRGLRSKLGTAIEYEAPGSTRLFLNATFRLEKFAFGGGNVQIQFSF